MVEPVRHVLLIMAMEQEAAPIVKRYGLKRLDDPFINGSPFVAWEGRGHFHHAKTLYVANEEPFCSIPNVRQLQARV